MRMPDVIASLRVESARLESELRLTSPEFRRLEAVHASIKRLAETYGSEAAKATHADVSAGVSENAVPQKGRTVRPDSISGRILTIAEEAMKDTGKRMRGGDVLKLVTESGIKIE